MKRVSLALAASLLATFSFSSIQAGAADKDSATIKPPETTESSTSRPVIAPNSEACLEQVRKMSVNFPKVAEAGKEAVLTMIPDPAAYEQKLPSIDSVLKDKDATNLKNYGGLAEAFLFKGEEEKALSLLKSVQTGSKSILPESDNFIAAVEGDFGLAYYLKDNFVESEKYLSSAVNQIEKFYQPHLANNLIASYLCLAIIKDKQGKTDEAKTWAKKLVVLALKQSQQEPVPTPGTKETANETDSETASEKSKEATK